jgi:hypothetical protein
MLTSPPGRDPRASVSRLSSKNCNRVAAVSVGALLLSGLPSTALAHVAQAGRVSLSAVVLAAAGLAAVVAGIALSSRRRRRVGLGVFVTGIVLMSLATADFAIDTQPRRSPATVSIAQPTWGSKVSQRFEVVVDLANATLVPMDRTQGPPNEGHLHLYANGRAVGMYSETRFEVELPPGKYVLQVEFTGADHLSFDPPVADTVEVEVVPTE